MILGSDYCVLKPEDATSNIGAYPSFFIHLVRLTILLP